MKNNILYFGEKMKDGRLTEPSSIAPFRAREAALEVKRLGRPLTDKEFDRFYDRANLVHHKTVVSQRMRWVKHTEEGKDMMSDRVRELLIPLAEEMAKEMAAERTEKKMYETLISSLMDADSSLSQEAAEAKAKELLKWDEKTN